ncbi:MAG: dihydrofolate reductase [Promethearchaeota archaeon]|jgi:dihydrofolate reductase
MIKMIGAMSLDRAIGAYEGKKGRLPWHENRVVPGDLEYMGRKTWESLGSQPLPNRQNIVVSSKMREKFDGVKIVRSIKEIIGWAFEGDLIFIGGSSVFSEAQRYVDEIIITLIPFKAYEHYNTESLVYFPEINTKIFNKKTVSHHPINPELRIIRYRK